MPAATAASKAIANPTTSNRWEFPQAELVVAALAVAVASEIGAGRSR